MLVFIVKIKKDDYGTIERVLVCGGACEILAMSSSKNELFDKSLCIICQKGDGNVTSSINGCQRIREAAIQRHDVILQTVKLSGA